MLIKESDRTMVLILDGKTEIVAQVRRNFCYLIYYRNLIRSRALNFFLRKDFVTI